MFALSSKPRRYRVFLAALAGAWVALAACSVPPTPTATPPPPATPTATPIATSSPSPATPDGPTPTAAPTRERRPTAVPPTPTATATRPPPSPTPTPGPPLMDAEDLPVPPDLDPLDLARRLKLGASTPISPVVRSEPLNRAEGDVEAFWVLDLNELRTYQMEAELRYVSPHAYWYVQTGASVSQRALERAATAFERDIYGPLTAALGTEWVPGVDGDPRMTILHGAIRGAAGYFSSTDEYPRAVYPYSNEREIMYINVGALEVGSPAYLGVLAHELQHAIHWRADRTEDTWINEGLAEVAKDVVGYPLSFPSAYLDQPRSSLVHWAGEPSQSVPQYGGASLFITYLLDHYGGPSAARRLMEDPEDSVAGVDAFLKAGGYDVTFEDVLADWAVATLLDLASGTYSYPGLDLPPPATMALKVGEAQDFSLDQTGVSYLEFTPRDGDVLRFQGAPATPLIPDQPPGGGACWWSNAGDSIDSMLTRAFDLTGVDAATLELLLWYNLEEGWDYTYLEVSADGGRTWEVLRGERASDESPVGTGMGPGYTGRSGGWVWDRVDLGPYAGKRIQVRLEYVTDDSVNLDGLCLASVRIPEIGYDYRADTGDDGWDAQGFVRVVGPLRQRFSVQVVLTEGEGRRVRVRSMALDEDNRGSLQLEGVEGFDRAVVVVVPLTYRTRQPADFTIEVRREG